jgi:hypothetical protein
MSNDTRFPHRQSKGGAIEKKAIVTTGDTVLAVSSHATKLPGARSTLRRLTGSSKPLIAVTTRFFGKAIQVAHHGREPAILPNSHLNVRST